MTPNKQQTLLNEYSMALGRYQSWGIIDDLNIDTPANSR